MPFRLAFLLLAKTLVLADPVGGATPAQQSTAIDPVAAAAVFAERQAFCTRDAGKLWGVDLCGPMLFVDPVTRDVVANRPSPALGTVPNGEVYIGKLPLGLPLSNTVSQVGNEKWSIVLWPLPEDPIARHVELMHESWHRIEDRLGLPITDPLNPHLETADGRYWMQMEWRALARAVSANGMQRKAAIADALGFRAARFAEFPAASDNENALLLFEGLAEDTGVALTTAPSDRSIRVVEELATARSLPSYVRTFAYASGAAYGALLDGALPLWRRHLTTYSDLGALVARAYGVDATDPKVSATSYDDGALRRSENARALELAEKVAALRAQFVTGPVIRIPLRGASVSFNPGSATGLGDAGSVYLAVTSSGWFGRLAAPAGALVANDFRSITLPVVPHGTNAPYDLELAAGCALEPDGSNQIIVCK